MSEALTIDQFQLTNCIATGSSSQIWEVTDMESNERFAMKLLLDEAFRAPEHKATLKREFKIASSFDHPNIIQVYTHKQTKKHAYYTMEYFGGPNLKQIIRGDRLVVHTRLQKFVECIVMALGHIHEKGWLHRDVKPDNIMMTKASDVRLVDFSLSSKAPSAVGKLLSGKAKFIQGTRTYIAPELVRKLLPSVQSDLYSLGVTIFECLTGRPPFLGTTPNDLLIRHIQEPPPFASTYNSNVTPEMDKLLVRLMAKNPKDRPASAGELLSEFRSLKVFLADPNLYDKEIKAKEKEAAAVSAESKLDSRLDAQRTENKNAGLEIPDNKPSPKKTVPPKPRVATQKPVAAKAQQVVAPPPQHQQPGYPQQQGYPQQPMQPGMPQQPAGMPPQAWPYGQQMPGYPVQQPPAGGHPPQPGHPPQIPIQQQAPVQQQIPQQRAGGQVPAQPTGQKKRAVPPPAPPKKSEGNINLDDLPLMDELPDIK